MSKILKNTIIYSLGNFVLALSSFILLPIYTKFLSVAEFGLVNSMQIFSSIFIIFLTLALERSLFRITYDYKEKHEKSIFFGTILITIFIISILVMAISFIISPLLQQLFKSIPFYPFFFYTIIYTFLLVFINYSQTISQVQQSAKSFLTISLSVFFLTAIYNIIFIVYLKMGATGYVLGMLFGAITVLPLIIYNLRNQVVLRWKLDMLKNALLFCVPMLPSLLFAWILNLSDRVIIDNYFSQVEVGIYSLGYKIASLIIFGGSAFYLAYNPLFYEVVNTYEEEMAKKIICSYNKLFISAVCAMGISILIFSDVLLKLFFKVEYLDAVPFLFGFTVSFMIVQLCGLFNLMMYQNKKSTAVAITIIICAIINIGLNFILIPRYGIIFGVLSSIICNVINFWIMFFLAKRNFYIRFNFVIPIITISVALILYYIRDYFLTLSLSELILIKSIIFIVIVFIFFFYHKNELVSFCKKIKSRYA
ncbi:MAG: oligosaccharide flippase family protein [Pyrinomonadaceae bacterium]|nr:oligosaccharide flippase family protein [Sphingobacteriaceae bacterium]